MLFVENNIIDRNQFIDFVVLPPRGRLVFETAQAISNSVVYRVIIELEVQREIYIIR